MKRAAPVSARWVFSDAGHFLAFGFGAGLAPVAPGTFGTVAAIPVFLLLQSAVPWLYMAVTLLFMMVGFYLCGRATRVLGVHDHPGIVWDEVVGFLITMAWAPAGWWWLLLGFVAFRIFDIVKPWPCRWIDRRVEGGVGIMLDDVVAGVYALALVQGAAWLSR